MMTFSKIYFIMTDNMCMNGLTITEIAEILHIDREAAKTRLIRAGIEPKTHAGKTNIYAESAVEAIRNVPGRGRPAKKVKKPKK